MWNTIFVKYKTLVIKIAQNSLLDCVYYCIQKKTLEFFRETLFNTWNLVFSFRLFLHNVLLCARDILSWFKSLVEVLCLEERLSKLVVWILLEAILFSSSRPGSRHVNSLVAKTKKSVCVRGKFSQHAKVIGLEA